MDYKERDISTSRIVLRWVLVALMAAFIFFMSSRTAGELNSGGLGYIKHMINNGINGLLGTTGDPVSTVAHFCEYLLLGIFLVNALRSHLPLGYAIAFAIVCASAYGLSDEFHQIFVKGRYCDPLDWLTDTLGACLGALLSWYALRRAR